MSVIPPPADLQLGFKVLKFDDKAEVIVTELVAAPKVFATWELRGLRTDVVGDSIGGILHVQEYMSIANVAGVGPNATFALQKSEDGIAWSTLDGTITPVFAGFRTEFDVGVDTTLSHALLSDKMFLRLVAFVAAAGTTMTLRDRKVWALLVLGPGVSFVRTS